MGAKYLPTIRDQKASERYQRKKNPHLPGFKKSAPGTTPAAPSTPAPASKIKKA